MLELDNAYNCEKCATKRDTLMRHCIKTLPNTLIFNLKRFDFDFEEMKKVKLNDYFEFPMELNVENYTAVGLAKKEREQQQVLFRYPKYRYHSFHTDTFLLFPPLSLLYLPYYIANERPISYANLSQS